MAQERLLEDLPRLDVRGLEIDLATGPWRGKVTKATDDNALYIKCGLRVATHNVDDYTQRNEPCWCVRLARRREYRGGRKVLSPNFEATIAHHPGGISSSPDGSTEHLASGYGRSWEDCISSLRRAPIIRRMRELAAVVYKDRKHWHPIRPFSVKYPFRTWDEPNAMYSPFQFRGAVFNHEDHGATATAYKPDSGLARRMAGEVGGNAFLTGPDDDGMFRLYHRRDMMEYDKISFDDWAARIIAGSGE